MADWSILESDLLIQIAKKLEYCEDFCALSGVCTWWRRALQHVHEPSPSRYLPWLMLLNAQSNTTRRFLGLDKRLVLEAKFTILTSTRNWENLFSSRGWIICVTGTRYDIILVHPLSKRVILPPIVPEKLSQLYDDSSINCRTKFCKFALSDNPLTASNYILAMIFPGFNGLGVWRSEDKEWTVIDYGFNFSYPSDVLFYNGDIYTVDCDGKVLATRICIRPTCSRLVTNLDIIQDTHPTEVYLVESSKVLLLIKRELCLDETNTLQKTCSFKVWEVNVDNGDIESVRNLRNKAVFLGYNNSSFSKAAFPPRICKANCIYYTNHHHNERGPDMGVFDLTDGHRINDLYGDATSLGFIENQRFSMRTSCLWVESSLMYPNYHLLGCPTTLS